MGSVATPGFVASVSSATASSTWLKSRTAPRQATPRASVPIRRLRMDSVSQQQHDTFQVQSRSEDHPHLSPHQPIQIQILQKTPVTTTTTQDVTSAHALPPLLANLTQNARTVQDSYELRSLFASCVRPSRLRLVLAGPPVSGKGTYAPLLARKYGMIHISTGSLLRDEVKKGTDLGKKVGSLMAQGQLLDDDLIVSVLANRISEEDCVQRGYILDGFPRSKEQADVMQKMGIAVDAVLLLSRSDEDILEWALQRTTDPLTGVIYHPKFNPPPDHILHRLEKRADDTEPVVRKRLDIYHQTFQGIYDRWKDKIYEIDTSTTRSFVEIFTEICDLLEIYIPGQAKLDDQTDDESENLILDDDVTHPLPSFRFDVEPLGEICKINGAHILAHQRVPLRIERGAVLRVVRECNRHDKSQYVPFYFGSRLIGYIGKFFAAEMKSACSPGKDCELHVELESCSLHKNESSEGEVRFSSSLMLCSVEERTLRFGKLMQKLRDRGLIRTHASLGSHRLSIPTSKDPRSTECIFKVSDDVARYLGVVSYGIHVNGYQRIGSDVFVWVARRDNRACAPWLDQLVSTTLTSFEPEKIPFFIRRKCIEKAGMADDLYEHVIPVSSISQRYESRTGLMTRRLWAYDVELPDGFTPRYTSKSGKTAVDFELVRASSMLERLLVRPEEWNSASALVFIDFCKRHGVITPVNEPDYYRISSELTAYPDIE